MATPTPHDPALTARVLAVVQRWAERRGWHGPALTALTRLERDLRLTGDDIFELCERVCDELGMEFRPGFRFAQQFDQSGGSLLDAALNTLSLIIPLRGMRAFTVELIAANLQPLPPAPPPRRKNTDPPFVFD